MKRRFVWILLSGILLALLTSCGGPELQPFSLGPAPWQNGEVSTYDVLNRSGAAIGQAVWSWQKDTNGWTQSYELNLGGRRDRGQVVMGLDLMPISSWRERSGTRYDTTYAPNSVTITTTASDGTVTTKELSRPADGLDNDQTLQVQRALTMAAGYAIRYTDVIPTTGALAPVKFIVTGAETVTVPAGTFPAWRVTMNFGPGSQHDGWYAQEAPQLLLKYRNQASGSEFHLRSWQPAAGEAVIQGSQAPLEPAAPAEPAPSGPPPLNIPFLVTALVVQYPLMLAFPLLLGWWIRRRYGVSWGIFGAGALTFVASQVVHLPLNWALGLLGNLRGVGLWPLVPLALVAGLSAGVCEEGARWIALRFFLKQARGWRAALQFGAGHGGAEAIIFGLLALANLIGMIALHSLDPAALGIKGVAADQVQAALAAYWASPWYMSALAGLERLFAITFHVALAVLVMRAVVRQRVGYLIAAITAHAAMDFLAVWGGKTVGPIWTEVIVGAVALAAFGLILKLRETPVPDTVPTPASIPTAANLTPRELTGEELARRAEESKYEGS